MGLSPRVRGNPRQPLFGLSLPRSIPACAGEPGLRQSRAIQLTVYPRVCGGTPDSGALDAFAVGLSPRVRGNRCAGRRPWRKSRSIPACAGEPKFPLLICMALSVYPRVCGGTSTNSAGRPTSTGLSPRVRGNRKDPHPLRLPQGSIPACAGEPGYALRRGALLAVYPRVCGGTDFLRSRIRGQLGLSPRVRGNLNFETGAKLVERSIPACAGEPSG